jgi:hypothetical protein
MRLIDTRGFAGGYHGKKLKRDSKISAALLEDLLELNETPR